MFEQYSIIVHIFSEILQKMNNCAVVLVHQDDEESKIMCKLKLVHIEIK